MADFPGAVYSPRTKANKPGVVYTAAKTTVGYAEDVSLLDAEVVAIENELGIDPKWDSASVAERLKGIRSLSDSDEDIINIKGGNVGIGTASPSAKLSLGSNINAQGLLIHEFGNFREGFGVLSGEFRQFWDSSGVMTFGTIGTGDGSTFTERMRITSDGNVGIGTASPSTPLTINTGNNKGLQLTYAAVGMASSDGFTIAHSSGDVYINQRENFDINFWTNNTAAMTIDNSQNVGIGTASPTTDFSVKEKAGISPIGGIMIKLTNKTGANSVAGQVVSPDTATDDAVILNAIGGVNPIGVFLESGISDGSEAWIVVSGIADVALDDNVAAVHGNWIGSGIAAGYASTGASPPAAPTHFEEIGHCIESVAAGGAGTHILARCVLHFN